VPNRQPALDARGGGPAQERELRERGKRTMRKLLDAGMTVFEARGYHAARVDDIVKVARTSLGTFYLYFSNKEDLFRALALDVADEMTALAQSLGAVDPGDDGYRELREWLGRFATLYEHYGPVIRAWTEAESTVSEFGRMGNDVLSGFTRALVERLREAGPSRQSLVDPQIGALALVAMIERYHYYVSSRRIRFDPDATLDTLATITHAGLFGGHRS
jgi:AcrR family transcriptional regulator